MGGLQSPQVGPHYPGDSKAALERLVQRGQGIVILHHALLAWEKWDFWDQVIGHDERNFRWKPELDLRIEVADKEHPITRGMADFDTIDEGYVLHGKHDGKSTILLTAEIEKHRRYFSLPPRYTNRRKQVSSVQFTVCS